MLNLILRILFGTRNQRQLNRIKPIVEKINLLEEEISKLSDNELKLKTDEFKQRLKNGETLDDILPEAFAVVRESSKRTIGLRHFDVQLMGGIVLHQGKIAEMKTGEGKTLVATLPVYLNALTGEGVHVVTVNDYLAKRDRYWMGPIYEFLGLTVGYIQHDMSPEERKKMYACDVTYVTNNELGFDYLRDNMVMSKEDCVLRSLNYAIVDEVDFILIDEARTPLIISGPVEESTHKYYVADSLVPYLKVRFIREEEEMRAKREGIDLAKGYDCLVDEKHHTVVLTDEGINKCERMLGLKNIYSDLRSDWVHHITQAVRAHTLFKRDVEYVVKDGEIVIVDEFTGRLMPGRRWSDGLHQAVEAKEKLRVKEEMQTLATITLQNLFRLYKKLAGMTGTAATEADELWEIYKLDVVVIPTHKPMIRKDQPDAVYRTEKEKWKAIIEDIKENYKVGRPVLVGTRSIEKSEKLSAELRKLGIPHQVLNAKYHEKEAQIIAQAGKKYTITVATNMAGRGVDIILGGNPPDPNEQREVIELGGLYILGTERHEARRIDYQLRGRSGRQGDPGESRFYVSLEDELMRLFGGERLTTVMEKLGMKEDEKIEHHLITKAIENAQKKVENMHFDIRKQLLEYDNVMNKQREVIYSLRRKMLEGEDVSDYIRSMIEESLNEKFDLWVSKKQHPMRWDLDSLRTYLKRVYGGELTLNYDNLPTAEELYELIKHLVYETYKLREQKFGLEFMREIERNILLNMIDIAWREHLYELDQLKKGISLRAYGQRDPLVEYKRESFELFNQMMTRIRESTIEYVFKIQPIIEERKVAEPVPLKTPREKITEKTTTVPIKKKIGRNDPCPCGSGKKYKHCCGGYA